MAKESTGKTFSFWFAEEEVEALAKKAKKMKITRNEAARRAVREYVQR